MEYNKRVRKVIDKLKTLTQELENPVPNEKNIIRLKKEIIDLYEPRLQNPVSEESGKDRE